MDAKFTKKQSRRLAMLLIVGLLMALTLSVSLTGFGSGLTTVQAASVWAPGVAYKAGDQVTYNGSTYQCLQAHTSQVGWEPPNVPALWQLISGGAATPTATAKPTATATPKPTTAGPTPTATATPKPGTPTPTAQPTATPTPKPNTPTPTPISGGRVVGCSTVSCLQSEFTNAQPGDDIVLAAGVTFTGTFKSAVNGTAAKPITLESSSATNLAIIAGTSVGGGYVFDLSGDYWVIKNLKFTNAQKGIVLDNSNNTVIDTVEVYNIGEEGVHFRDGSSYNTLKNSYVHDTGQSVADYGEGVYVGSDNGKWNTYNPAANYNTIDNDRIGPNVAAEHVDIKEGTTGTVVENCTLNGTGISGANYADSFIDVKGNDASIHNNTGSRNGNPKIADAFQVHVQVSGWGQNADFSNNTVYLDDSTEYVVNAASGATAKVHNNTRSPSGNMYNGSVTAY